MIPSNKKKTILNTALHLVFWVGVCYFFTNYSFLRPAAAGTLYKELLVVLFITTMVYVNYLFLIPKYFQTCQFKRYWLYAITSVLITSFCEFILIAPNMFDCVVKSLPLAIIHGFFRTILFLIILRNFGFFLFFFMIKLYSSLRNKYLQEKQTVSEATGSIFISSPQNNIQEIPISKIAFVLQEKNRSYFHLIDGTKMFQYNSLTTTAHFFPKGTFLKINRNTLVVISNILSYNERSVVVNFKKGEQNISLPILHSYVATILPYLKQRVFDNDENQHFEKTESTNEVVQIEREKAENILLMENAKKFHLNSIEEKIYFFIAKNHGAKKSQIAEETLRSQKTVEIYIKKLKELGLIEYRGTSRNGGYYASDKE